jgi:hypothetical protein
LRKTVVFLFMAVLPSPFIHAQTQQPQPSTDEAGIKQAALDYIEGWYEGNPERIEGCVLTSQSES